MILEQAKQLKRHKMMSFKWDCSVLSNRETPGAYSPKVRADRLEVWGNLEGGGTMKAYVPKVKVGYEEKVLAMGGSL